MNVTIVTLSHFPEIFHGFMESMDREAELLPKFCVWDGPRPNGLFDGRGGIQSDWLYVQGEEPFKIARNANAGWSCANPIGTDILYAGDDTRIIEPDTIKRLCAFAEAHPDFGIVAPRIKDQDSVHPGEFTIAPYVPFVFVLIKREVIEKIGYLDERFEGYGCEDISYCIDARLAGFKIAYANSVWIKHGIGEHKWGSTFKRLMTEQERIAQDSANWVRFASKYGLPPGADNVGKIWEFLKDCDKVGSRSGQP